MISKCLEKKIEIIPDGSIIECKNPIELEYYLIESETQDINDVSEEKVYGLEIVKKVKNKKVESSFVRNYSCCKEAARNTLNKLANNSVTPMCLSFVLDDIIGI